MRGDGKGKWRWSSKSPFGSKAPNKALICGQSTQDCDDCAIDKRAVIGVSSDSYSNEGENVRSRLKAKMRGSGSKFLSVVGFQRSSGTQSPARRLTLTDSQRLEDTKPTEESQIHTNERDIALAIVKDAAVPNAPEHLRANGINSLRPLNIPPARGSAPRVPNCPSNTHSTLGQTEAILSSVSGGISGSSLLDPFNSHVKRKEPTGLRKSTSNPTFAHQLSHKLSETFGNPTIVHRPKLRTRPSLLSVHEGPVPSGVQSDHELSPLESTAPSSYNYGSSVSAGDRSTGKTSLESNVASLRSAIIQEGKDGLIDARKVTAVESGPREKALTPIQEAPHVVNPSVVTVETTACAKIFFETYFNSLLTESTTSRSTRRRDLELRLQAQPFSEERRQFERWAWASCESDHLRQSRVLSSKTNGVSKGSGVAIAGYEIVRILGKGSFGVVRLVRGRKSDTAKPTVVGVCNSAAQSWRKGPRGELIDLKANAIEALKSTLEGQRPPQRQNFDKPRREVYAMKVIRKSDMLRNCQEGHLRAERDFLVAAAKSRWVAPLIASFQDNTNLYLVMEYMVGGDFLGLLFRKNILMEKHARWYIAEMILCIEETHRSKWIHRDIKPDNFLISASGHLKISDFGLAFDGHWAHDQRYYKNQRRSLMERLGIEVRGDSEDQEEDARKKLRSNLANILTGRVADSSDNTQNDGPGETESILQWRNRHGKRRMAVSVVGTSQYMAPEVVRGDPYDGRCDWWSVGIILYECLYGFTPFVCENREETKAKILNNTNSLVFPDEREVERREKVSFEAMELINSLLQEKEHRLSSKKYRLNDWQHSRRVPGQLVARRADPLAQDYRGSFVYPDDATDIKAHPFFDRIAWDRLHLTRPPFVPDVSGGDDTKYFDEEDPVSDVDDAASQTSRDEASDEDMHDNPPATQITTQVDGAQGHHDRSVDTPANCGTDEHNATVYPNMDGKKGKTARVRAEKRPRDRVLRDKEVGRKALEIRKKGAFLGYTYRRPKPLLIDDEQEKQWAARRSLPPDFD